MYLIHIAIQVCCITIYHKTVLDGKTQSYNSQTWPKSDCINATALHKDYPAEYFSKFSMKNICCGYSLEAPHACLFVCVEVLRPSQPNGVMSSVVSLPNHTFTGQA